MAVRRVEGAATMYVTLSVVGGILGTALVVDELDDCRYSDGDVFCADP